MIYFTADPHFNHSNIIELNKRPFVNIDQMNNKIIQNWNSCVTPDDEIYILGDFMFNGSGNEANNFLSRLNGIKYLIKGNHDEKYLKDEMFYEDNFEWVKDYYVLYYNKIKIVMFHYPILEWDGYYKDAIHLHGHVHNCSKYPDQQKRVKLLGKKAINVGVDVNNFFPIIIEKVMKMTE
jgi:calcineurin-like phosphoesterase family protein